MSGNRTSATITLGSALLAATFASCNSGPAAIQQPSISASGAGSKAMELYDKDGDGKVAGAELDQAPALKAALATLDTNGDKGVSADEVAARVNVWKEMRTGLVSVQCNVTLDGQPLVGATVAFVPEEFLGDEIKTARATTNPYGQAAPTVAPEDRPAPNLPGGAHFGLYKVQISKMVNGKETIPARYNTATSLGQQVSYDDPAVKNRNMTFALKTSP